MATVYVNGEKCTLHESVGWLNYDRVVRLSSMPFRDDYLVLYHNNLGSKYMHDIGGGVFPLDGMSFHVTVDKSKTKPWWRWLWPE